MATHSSILAWEIPLTEEPGGPQSTGVTEAGTTEQQQPPLTYPRSVIPQGKSSRKADNAIHS